MGIPSERKAWSYSAMPGNEGTTYCYRQRCTTRIQCFKSEEGYIYPYDTVVISMSGGDRHYAFCSDKCAALWLNSLRNLA